MDYEKKYKEALERAKDNYNAANSANINVDSFKNTLTHIFPELKESEDEKIRKAIIEFFELQDDNTTYSLVPKKDILAWLEKQGENTYNKELSELLHKVICRFINDPDIPYSDREKVSMKVLPYVERLEKQGEQKPVDNVEPKFHKGDWVVFNNNHQSIYQVEKIEDGYYILIHTHGGTFRVCVLHDEDLRLWTIQDAEDGDVLYSHEHNLLWIYEDKDAYHVATNLNYTHNISIDGDIAIPSDVCPATKEQRDTLEKAMANAGHKWDVNKKELIKL